MNTLAEKSKNKPFHRKILKEGRLALKKSHLRDIMDFNMMQVYTEV